VTRCYCAESESPLFWPAPPAEMRVSFVRSVYSPSDTGIKPGFFKKLKGVILGEEKNVLNKPIALALDSRGAIYVCDAGAPAVHIFRKKEKKYTRITAINKERLVSPVGVAVSDNGLIFISDSGLKKVFCLDSNGRFKFSINGANKILRPTGLVIVNKRLYVVDTLAHSILIFDLKGNFLSSFGSRGKGDGEFNYPTSISVDNEGKVYVVDTLNFRIQVFDENNKFLYAFGKLGDSSGSFSRPKGVAIDTLGHIYTTDGLFDNIQIFNKERELLLFLGESGHKDGEFWIPCGLAIDNENYIYVADSYNQRIQIFRYVGKD
jgi:DNA-binding beta-propeller fold protein YncE